MRDWRWHGHSSGWDCWTPPHPSSLALHSIWFFQFSVQKINWTRKVQSRRAYETCNPVLCFTCKLIFIELRFLFIWTRIRGKWVKMFSSSGQSCQHLTWPASCEIPERDYIIFLYIGNKKQFLWSLLFKPEVCSVLFSINSTLVTLKSSRTQTLHSCIYFFFSRFDGQSLIL